MLGQMYSTQEALDIGMVDKLVPEADVMSAAQQEIQQWLKIPGTKRAIYRRFWYTKQCSVKGYDFTCKIAITPTCVCMCICIVTKILGVA